MNNSIINATEKIYGIKPKIIEPLGGGFYGRAFLVCIECEPFTLVAKLYLFPGIAIKEAEQIEALTKPSRLKMPRIYGVLEKEKIDSAYDVLLMEYISGKNAGWLNTDELHYKHIICEEIVDNLISVHSTVNPNGFGELSSKKYCGTWQEYYYPIAENTVRKAKVLYEKGQLSPAVMDVFERSLEHFYDIFCLPITEARLVHGDYNTWNIMLDERCHHAIAVIDPFNCCWADSEIDLYQLDNANGKGYELLKRYAEKVPLSENFEAKRRFYELYSEVSHYHDSQVEVDLPAVESLASKLTEKI